MARKKSFNATGPCDPQEHYMVDAMRGLGKVADDSRRAPNAGYRRDGFRSHTAIDFALGHAF